MDISHLLARLFGVMMIVLFGGILLNQKFYSRLWQDISHHPFSLLISGFITLLLGLIVLQVHHIWVADWRGLITLLGWFFVLTGAVRILLPEMVLKIGQKIIKQPLAIISTASVMFLIGLYLTYMGFFH
jgi:hypothetical protein